MIIGLSDGVLLVGDVPVTTDTLSLRVAQIFFGAEKIPEYICPSY